MVAQFSLEPIESRLISSLLWDAPEPVDDFWANVQVGLARQCWPWVGQYTTLYGYGLWYQGPLDTSRLAHRESFRRCRGSIADGLWVLHRCDNPRCVNPAHLFLGTPKDNVHDSMAKGRRRVSSGSTPYENLKELRRRRLSDGVCLSCGGTIDTTCKTCRACRDKQRVREDKCRAKNKPKG